jgi:hypothetical protein
MPEPAAGVAVVKSCRVRGRRGYREFLEGCFGVTGLDLGVGLERSA